jgi:hypothetical protein
MKAPRHSLLKMSDLQSGVETLTYVTDHDAAALEAQFAEAIAVLGEVVRISDRKHDAWDRAHALIAKAEGTP